MGRGSCGHPPPPRRRSRFCEPQGNLSRLRSSRLPCYLCPSCFLLPPFSTSGAEHVPWDHEFPSQEEPEGRKSLTPPPQPRSGCSLLQRTQGSWVLWLRRCEDMLAGSCAQRPGPSLRSPSHKHRSSFDSGENVLMCFHLSIFTALHTSPTGKQCRAPFSGECSLAASLWCGCRGRGMACSRVRRVCSSRCEASAQGRLCQPLSHPSQASPSQQQCTSCAVVQSYVAAALLPPLSPGLAGHSSGPEQLVGAP